MFHSLSVVYGILCREVRDKRVIGDALRPRTDQRRASEVAIAVEVLNTYAGAGTPGLCPHRLKPDRVGVIAPAPLIHATRSLEGQGEHPEAGWVAPATPAWLQA